MCICSTFLADVKDDKRMFAIVSDALIAKGSVYQPKCHRKYTICVYNCQSVAKNEKSILQIAFDVLEKRQQPGIVELIVLTDRLPKQLNKSGYDLDIYGQRWNRII